MSDGIFGLMDFSEQSNTKEYQKKKSTLIQSIDSSVRKIKDQLDERVAQVIESR